MTQKEFRQALLRGQGRCIPAVKNDPERYRDLVMWACQRRISFDTQCEGARTWFVYQMVNCYEDTGPFVEAAARSLRRCPSNGDWTVFALSELLWFFAVDGNAVAEAALEEKYRELYDGLMARKRRKNGRFPELDDFSQLCVILAEGEASVVRIATDVGRLCRLRPFYHGFDFAWLHESKGKQYLSALKKGAESSEDLACYLETQQSREAEQAPARERKGARLSLWLARKADPQTVEAYARAYREQMDPNPRSEALDAFRHCPYPGDPTDIIRDADAEWEPLRQAAWRALKNIRHPSVREFALSKVKTDLVEAFAVLARNYQPEDAPLLTELVQSVPTDFQETGPWHTLQMDVLGMEDFGLEAPPALLRHIYETTYCSCCRFHALRQMGSRHMLTRNILEECRFDSSSDIREYAEWNHSRFSP